MKKVNSKLLKDSLTRKEMRMIAGGGSYPNVYEYKCYDGTYGRGLTSCSNAASYCVGHGGLQCCALEDTTC